MKKIYLENDDATNNIGKLISEDILNITKDNIEIHLEGDLGAGKTFLTRSIISHAGWSGLVKSPTYTLLEPYRTACGDVFHFDLYRLKSPEELEFLGFDEIFAGPGYKFVEWPEQGSGWLPPANVEVSLSLHKPASAGGEVQQMQREVSVRFA